MENPERVRLTRAQVREIDRLAIEEYGIPGIVLMENAALRAVEVAIDMLDGRNSCVIACGPGNNGGDGLAMARHLHNRGVSVEIVLADDPDRFFGDALINWQIVTRMKLHWTSELPQMADPLWIDGIFGTGLTRPPGARAKSLIEQMNDCAAGILALDLPSGLDCDTGEPAGACVRATRTVTFVAEKSGFASPVSRQYTGQIIVADIGCPRELIEQVAGLR